MRTCFISLMKGFSWGGSEELWSMVANLAIEEGNKILVSVKYWDNLHDNILQLQRKGAVLHLRNRPAVSASLSVSYLRYAFKKAIEKVKIRQQNEWAAIDEFKPQSLVISFGGMYDILSYKELIEFLEGYKQPYFFICQLNLENLPLADAQRQIARKLFLKARNVFFVSERNKVVAERNMVVKLDNAIITSNPLKFSVDSPVPFKADSVIRFASVARFDTKYKGQDVLLEILASENWKNRDWFLNLYGSGPDINYLTELIIFFGLEEKVKINSHVRDIKSVWLNNHILLMPSSAEGTPLSLIEAMYCARTALVTDVGGNASLISDGVNGFLAESQSVASFSNGLERAWERRGSFKEMGEAAYNTIRMKVPKDSYKSVYKAICSSSQNAIT